MTLPAPADPRTVVILGVPFHDVTMAETLEHIDYLISTRRSHFLATANLDFAAQASQDVELQRILLEAYLVLCDGTPLIWASKWLRAPIRERVAGSDLMPVLTAHCAKHGHRMFLLGASDLTLEQASARMLADHPDLIIAGTYAPPIAKLLDFNNDEIMRRLAEARPDVLIVCFGCPKQEKWIYMNLARLNVPVSIGLGATLDFVAGNFKRAPVWMRRCGLEWVFRLMQEPRRLFNRYWFDLLFFVRALRKQKRLLSAAPAALPAAAPTPKPVSATQPTTPIHVITWTGRADAASVAAGRLVEPPADALGGIICYDLSEVSFLDSTGLGALLRAYRLCKARGGELALINPSPTVVKLLAAMKLDRLLPTSPSVAAAQEKSRVSVRAGGHNDHDLELTVDGEIIAHRCAELKKWIETSWADQPFANRLVINLDRVQFVDSSGLGLFVATRRLVNSRTGARLVLRGANANIRNVITLARMDEFLGLAPGGNA